MPEQTEKVDQVLKQFSELQKIRKPWEKEWQDIADYIHPRRAIFDWSKDRHGEKTGTVIYDSMGQDCNKIRAQALQGYCTSAASDWFKLTYEDEEVMNLPGARMWLQEVERRFYSIFRESNFYEAIYNIFLDEGAFATATIYIELDPDRREVIFSARHTKEIYIAENHNQVVDTVFRRFYMSARELIKVFGKDKFEDEWLDRAHNLPYEQHLVLHAVFPREDRDMFKVDQVNKRFASIYILEDTKTLLREGGYEELPYVVIRSGKNPGEMYGRGVSHDALPEIIQAQQITKDTMRARQKAVDPPVTYPQELIGKLDLDPGGEMPVSDPSQRVNPVNLGQYLPAGTDEQQSTWRRIREKYNVDFWLMLRQMENTVYTATQVMQMQAEQAAILGTLLGLINNQLLDPVFDRVFSICYRAGKFPPPPPALMRSGAKIRVNYVGPLAQKQKQFHSVYGLNQALGQFLPLIQYDPSIKDVLNWSAAGRVILESGGAPAEVIHSEDEIAAIKKMRAELEQAALQQQQGQHLADVYKKTAQAPERGSGAEALKRALSDGQ